MPGLTLGARPGSEVLGSMDVPSNPDAPQLARAALGRWIPDSVPRGVARDAQLLVTELVANSVLHSEVASDAPITVRAGRTETLVWCEVTDEGRAGSVTRRLAAPSSGMGLNMVDAASSRWGSSHDDGTKVWFELAL